MRLSWDYSYEDYNDTPNWDNRFEQLKAIFHSLDFAYLQSADEETFLGCLEDLEELLRFYTSQVDFANLEPVMRAYQKLLSIGDSRGITHIGFLYSKMEFTRVNGLLYRSQDQNKQAAVYYSEFVNSAKYCFEQLQNVSYLSDKQILFVGWACVEGVAEAAEIFDKLLDVSSFVKACAFIYESIEWLNPYLYDAYGICEKVSEICASVSGSLYQAGEFLLGKNCFEKAIELFNDLDQICDSAYYAARALWIHSQYGLVEFAVRGNADVMLKCEADTQKFIQSRAKQTQDVAIATSIMGIINLQRSVVLQQQGKLADAIQLGKESCKLLSGAISDLEQQYQNCDSHQSTVLKNIAAKIFSNYLSALDSLGVQLFYNQQNSEAKDYFLQAANLLENNAKYTIGGSGTMILKAEIFFYLGMIYYEAADADKASFYAMQAADISYELWTNSRAQNILELSIGSCSVASEIMLALKDKPAAGKYAAMGLEACDALYQIAPNSERLEMRSMLEKYRKKAARKFF